VDKQMKINPAEAPIRRLIYELFAEHKRYKTVARLINDAGHRTRRGKKFSDIEIFRCLADPSAKGMRRANYSGKSPAGKTIIKPESQWVHVPVESIVSEELWECCHAMIEDRKVGPRIAKKPVHLFAGVTWCICGNKMYVPSNTPKYVCKRCRNKIPVVDLEGIFQEQLKSISLAPHEVAKYLHQADKTLAQKQEMLNLLTEERSKISQSMDRTYELFLGRHLTADSFGTRHKPLEERLQQIDQELPRLQAEVDFLKISYLSKDEVLTNARNLYTRWPQLAYEERRQITDALAQKIVVGKGEIDIELCYLPPSQPLPHQKVAKGQQNL
jgi:site-specific DNA recombinase